MKKKWCPYQFAGDLNSSDWFRLGSVMLGERLPSRNFKMGRIARKAYSACGATALEYVITLTFVAVATIVSMENLPHSLNQPLIELAQCVGGGTEGTGPCAGFEGIQNDAQNEGWNEAAGAAAGAAAGSNGQEDDSDDYNPEEGECYEWICIEDGYDPEDDYDREDERDPDDDRDSEVDSDSAGDELDSNQPDDERVDDEDDEDFCEGWFCSESEEDAFWDSQPDIYVLTRENK